MGELCERGEVRMLYVQGLPETAFAVPVFRNCYPQALSLATGGRAPARMVSGQNAPGTIHPQAMESWVLAPGEYLVAWRAERGAMEVVRRGRPR